MIIKYIIAPIVIFNTFVITLLLIVFIGKKEARTYMQSVEISQIFGDD